MNGRSTRELLLGVLAIALIFEIIAVGTCIGNLVFFALNLYNTSNYIPSNENNTLLAFNAIVVFIGLFAFILTCVGIPYVTHMTNHYDILMYKIHGGPHKAISLSSPEGNAYMMQETDEQAKDREIDQAIQLLVQ